MRRFRYETGGRWYKGNVHVHSTASDGGKTFAELAGMYAGAGYDFVVRTDHWVCSDVAADAGDWPLLWLDGIELDGQDEAGSGFHVVCLGRTVGLDREMGLVPAMAAAREQGAMLVLAHPHWSGNSLRDALRHGFAGVEVYNHVCRWMNGKGDGGVYWTAMLDAGGGSLAFAVDDAHVVEGHPGWDGGWVMVRAGECTREAIGAALRAGNFYSSCGPEIREIGFDNGRLRVATSPVSFIRLVGPGSWGRRVGSFDGETFTEASFDVPADWAWAYVEIEDDRGRHAWTNTLFAGAGGAV